MGRPSRYPDEFRQANPLSVRPSEFEDLRRLRREDVDLMVIGHADVGEVRPEADVAARRLGRDVNATVLTPEERERGGLDSSPTSRPNRWSLWTCSDETSREPVVTVPQPVATLLTSRCLEQVPADRPSAQLRLARAEEKLEAARKIAAIDAGEGVVDRPIILPVHFGVPRETGAHGVDVGVPSPG